MFKLNPNFVLYASIFWVCYGVFILVKADVNWREELREDGWYRIYEEDETEYDGRGGHSTTTYITSTDGPYSKDEIDKLYSNEVEENKIFMNKYGTIYNLPYWLYSKNSIILGIIGMLIHISFFLSIPALLYNIGKHQEKNQK